MSKENLPNVNKTVDGDPLFKMQASQVKFTIKRRPGNVRASMAKFKKVRKLNEKKRSPNVEKS
jgi:hypothetical protein